MERHFKVLIHGDTGAGKTRIGCTAPKPVILLTESNGLMTVQEANPDAIVVECENLDDARAFIIAAADGTLAEETGCETIVFDSLTELQRMIHDEIMSRKEGKPGVEPRMEIRDWGTLADTMRKMVRQIRNLPFNVVAIALTNHEVDESTGTRYSLPAFQGRKTPNEIAQYFSAVGYAFREQVVEDDKQVVRHRVLFRGPNNYMVKPVGGLAAVEEPDVATWIGKCPVGGTGKAEKEVADPDAETKTKTKTNGSKAASRRRRRQSQQQTAK
jgi:hypothetical protein